MDHIIIPVEDEIGVVANLTKALADNGINIATIDVEGVEDRGVVILSTDDDDHALHVLAAAGFRAVTSDTLVLRLPDEPGALAKVAERFKDAGVNIRSLHILSRYGGHAMLALTADDRTKAEALIDPALIV